MRRNYLESLYPVLIFLLILLFAVLVFKGSI